MNGKDEMAIKDDDDEEPGGVSAATLPPFHELSEEDLSSTASYQEGHSSSSDWETNDGSHDASSASIFSPKREGAKQRLHKMVSAKNIRTTVQLPNHQGQEELGITITKNHNHEWVLSEISDSSSLHGSLCINDKILTIGNTPLSGMDQKQIQQVLTDFQRFHPDHRTMEISRETLHLKDISTLDCDLVNDNDHTLPSTVESFDDLFDNNSSNNSNKGTSLIENIIPMNPPLPSTLNYQHSSARLESNQDALQRKLWKENNPQVSERKKHRIQQQQQHATPHLHDKDERSMKCNPNKLKPTLDGPFDNDNNLPVPTHLDGFDDSLIIHTKKETLPKMETVFCEEPPTPLTLFVQNSPTLNAKQKKFQKSDPVSWDSSANISQNTNVSQTSSKHGQVVVLNPHDSHDDNTIITINDSNNDSTPWSTESNLQQQQPHTPSLQQNNQDIIMTAHAHTPENAGEGEIIVPEATPVNDHDDVDDDNFNRNNMNNNIPSAIIVRPEKYSLTIAGRKIHVGIVSFVCIAMIALIISLSLTIPEKNTKQVIVSSPASSMTPSSSMYPSQSPSFAPSTRPTSILYSDLFQIIYSKEQQEPPQDDFSLSKDDNATEEESTFASKENDNVEGSAFFVPPKENDKEEGAAFAPVLPFNNNNEETPVFPPPDNNDLARYKALTWLEHDQAVRQIESKLILTMDEIKERYALALLYFSSNGDNENYENENDGDENENEWYHSFNVLDTSLHVCDWRKKRSWEKKGVLSCQDGRVIRLELYQNNLRGTIPDELGFLTKLSVLRLYGNDLGGKLPDSLGSLRHLSILDLNNNKFSGDIPESYGSLINLKELILSNNDLTGRLINVENMTQLEVFKVDGNQLTGNVPESFGNITSLESLFIDRNKISGSTEFMCNGNLPQEFKFDCDGDVPEILCSCCIGCTIVSDENCDSNEVLVYVDVLTGNNGADFFWELAEIQGMGSSSSSSSPYERFVAAGGDYEDNKIIEFQLCLLFSNTYQFRTMSNGKNDGLVGLRVVINEFYVSLSAPDSFSFSLLGDGTLSTESPTLMPSYRPTIQTLESASSSSSQDSASGSSEASYSTGASGSGDFYPTGPSGDFYPTGPSADTSITFPSEDAYIKQPNPSPVLKPTSMPDLSSFQPTTMTADSTDHPTISWDTLPPVTSSPTNYEGECIPFDLTLRTDGFADETSWEIMNKNDGSLVESRSDFMTNETNHFHNCLTRDGCFIFTIYDSFDDGICCEHGDGFFNISFSEKFSNQGGDFSSFDTVELGGSCAAKPVDGVCPDGDGLLNVTIIADLFGDETSWEVFDVSTGQILTVNPHVMIRHSRKTTLRCIRRGNCNAFAIYDSYGDGLGQSEQALYEVTFDDVIVTSGGGNFGFENVTMFGPSCAPFLY